MFIERGKQNVMGGNRMLFDYTFSFGCIIFGFKYREEWLVMNQEHQKKFCADEAQFVESGLDLCINMVGKLREFRRRLPGSRVGYRTVSSNSFRLLGDVKDRCECLKLERASEGSLFYRVENVLFNSGHGCIWNYCGSLRVTQRWTTSPSFSG